MTCGLGADQYDDLRAVTQQRTVEAVYWNPQVVSQLLIGLNAVPAGMAQPPAVAQSGSCSQVLAQALYGGTGNAGVWRREQNAAGRMVLASEGTVFPGMPAGMLLSVPYVAQDCWKALSRSGYPVLTSPTSTKGSGEETGVQSSGWWIPLTVLVVVAGGVLLFESSRVSERWGRR